MTRYTGSKNIIGSRMAGCFDQALMGEASEADDRKAHAQAGLFLELQSSLDRWKDVGLHARLSQVEHWWSYCRLTGMDLRLYFYSNV
jgi:hypothetical protein